MKRQAICTLLMAVWVCGCAHHGNPDPGQGFALEKGDLLFQDLDGSPLCDAIETVTHGYHGAHLSHVAMVVETKPQPEVIEAIGPGVVITPLPKFLSRSHDAQGRPKVIVGRLKAEYRSLIPPALTYAKAQLGKPYDKPFTLTEDSFYCSELIYFAFEHANGEHPLFTLSPMTFKDPQTQAFFPAWVDYYQELHVPIPQGQPGCNPGGMSREACISIVYQYGQPDGMVR